MLKRLTCLAASLLILCEARASAPEFVRISSLASLENATIYSIAQSSDYVIWISSSLGLMRYNGCSVHKVHHTLPMRPMSYDGGNLLWAVDFDSLLSVDVRTLEKHSYTASGIDFSRSKLCAAPNTLYLASGKNIYTCIRDSLALYLRTDVPGEIDYMAFDRDSVLTLSSGNRLYKFSSGVLHQVAEFPSALSCFYYDSSGYFWVGWAKGGFSKYDSAFVPLRAYTVDSENTRTFCEDKEGRIYTGSATTLYCVDSDDTLLPPFKAFSAAQPVTSLLADRAGNIWAGTFYSGLWLSPGFNMPFDNLAVPQGLRYVRSAAALSDGRKVVLTDGNGAYLFDGKRFSLVPGTLGYKFLSSTASPEGDCVYAGLHTGDLIRISSRRILLLPVHLPDGRRLESSVNALLCAGGRIFCGTNTGLYELRDNGKFAAATPIAGVEQQILALATDEQDRIWMAGKGLYLYDRNENVHKVSDGNFPAVCCWEGSVWLSVFGRGFRRLTHSDSLSYDVSSCGIADNFVSFIEPLRDGDFLLGTRAGISIFDSTTGRCRNYGKNSGLSFSSARSGAAIHCGNDRVLVCGMDGAVLLREDDIMNVVKENPVCADIVTVNGKWLARPTAASLTFSAGQNNLSIEFSNFDYPGIFPSQFLYSFSPSKGNWTPFDVSSPLSLVNLHPGRYTLEIKSLDGRESARLSFRIRPPWYFSTPAIIIFTIFILSLGIVILTMYYRRLLLAQKLRDKEEENAERTRLFIKLSHDIRTPLSALMGHMEMYFGRYGKNVPGSTLLKQSYKGALDMNKIISGFLEIEESTPSEDITDLPEFKHEDMYRIVPKEFTMLIADDDPDMRSLLKEVFKDEYELLFASDGKEACRIAHDLQPDIIVSDVMMPEMDGMTLCATLRKDYETRHIPIVLITAHASERHNLEGIALGADDYVTKPFSVELLRARCRTLIVNRKALMDKIAVRNPSAAVGVVGKRRENFLNAAIGAVERNISSKELNVGMLCSLMNVSKTTLTSKLEAACGMSPRDFIEDIKLKYAARLLSEGGSRISEIADSLNFSSQKYFTLRFKKKFGVPPSEYGK